MSIKTELDFVYICSDGRKFLDRKEAEEYDKKLNSIIKHYNIFGDFDKIVE